MCPSLHEVGACRETAEEKFASITGTPEKGFGVSLSLLCCQQRMSQVALLAASCGAAAEPSPRGTLL